MESNAVECSRLHSKPRDTGNGAVERLSEARICTCVVSRVRTVGLVGDPIGFRAVRALCVHTRRVQSAQLGLSQSGERRLSLELEARGSKLEGSDSRVGVEPEFRVSQAWSRAGVLRLERRQWPKLARRAEACSAPLKPQPASNKRPSSQPASDFLVFGHLNALAAAKQPARPPNQLERIAPFIQRSLA